MENGVEIGVVNSRDGQSIKELASAFTNRLELHIKRGYDPKAGKSKSGRNSMFDIILYGDRLDLTRLGDFLSDRSMFLQEPQHLPLETHYHNPHIFTAIDESRTPLFSKENFEKSSKFEKEVEAVMNMSIDISIPASFVRDPRISSPLFPLVVVHTYGSLHADRRQASDYCCAIHDSLRGRGGEALPQLCLGP